MHILQMAFVSFFFPALKSKTTQEVHFLTHFLLKSLVKYLQYILVSFLSPKENETKLKTTLLSRRKYLPLLQVGVAAAAGSARWHRGSAGEMLRSLGAAAGPAAPLRGHLAFEWGF